MRAEADEASIEYAVTGAGLPEPPLVSGEPIREWAFSELRGDSLEEVEVDDDTLVGGLLHELHDFGPTSRDSDVFDPDGSSLPPDGIATGQIASTADGITYWVGAEAPRGIASLPEDPIGGRSRLPRPGRSSSGSSMRRCRSR